MADETFRAVRLQQANVFSSEMDEFPTSARRQYVLLGHFLIPFTALMGPDGP